MVEAELLRAFQRWFRIENQTVIKGFMETFIVFWYSLFWPNYGGTLIRDNTVLNLKDGGIDMDGWSKSNTLTLKKSSRN